MNVLCFVKGDSKSSKNSVTKTFRGVSADLTAELAKLAFRFQGHQSYSKTHLASGASFQGIAQEDSQGKPQGEWVKEMPPQRGPQVAGSSFFPFPKPKGVFDVFGVPGRLDPQACLTDLRKAAPMFCSSVSQTNVDKLFC